MQDYSSSMSSLTEVQRIIGLSLSKIQIGRNQRGGLPLHKNLLVATVLNKARDLYMQETMYMNYKMMTGQLGAAQMTCMAMHAAPPPVPEVEPEEAPKEPAHLEAPPPPAVPTGSRSSDEGFIDEPDCDCDARNFSSESSRVPFTYCYQCAPFHPSNGRGPTLVPDGAKSSASSLEAAARDPFSPHEEEDEEESRSGSSSSRDLSSPGGGGHSTIYNMDSKATELKSNGTISSVHSCSSSKNRKRRLSDPSDGSSLGSGGGKRNRTSSCPDESDLHSSQVSYSFPSPPSNSSSPSVSSSSEEVFHPAFRQCSPTSVNFHHQHSPQFPSSGTTSSGGGSQSSPNNNNNNNGPASMEIEQITSLVSIFSFGQQIMAAAVEANKRLQQKSSSAFQLHDGLAHPEPAQQEEASSPTPEETSESPSKKEEDSDSESDTSSDSGHSSDDLEASSPEEVVVPSASCGALKKKKKSSPGESSDLGGLPPIVAVANGVL